MIFKEHIICVGVRTAQNAI